MDGRAQQSRVVIPHWPKEYGGAGLSHGRVITIPDEIARADARLARMFIISLIHMPGTLPHGTEAQKRRYPSGVANGEVWCQDWDPGSLQPDILFYCCILENIVDRFARFQ